MSNSWRIYNLLTQVGGKKVGGLVLVLGLRSMILLVWKSIIQPRKCLAIGRTEYSSQT